MMLTILLAITSALAEEEAASGFTLREIWDHSGGLAKGVIVMLALMLLASLFVAVERLIAFRSAQRRSMELAAQIGPVLEAGDVGKALQMSRDDAYKGSYLAGMLRAGLAELDLRLDAFGIGAAERAVEKAIGQEIAKLRRGMPILATTGSTAPFVGLFGTTFGVINAFQGMASAGAGLAAISAGISEALITTGVGIGVAVLGVWFFNYFTNRIDKVTEELASSEADFLDWAEKLVQARVEAEAAK
ncbi:MAG: MotA/TolQ/ExbB proton channel family protein [Alphaproteobacteria bacterium]|nr:MotA/TolQ/ExbB proton channel family protein [Alphaproteobacteria bacterium]